nr:ATPase, T2SS/T4P/T4SS family [Thioalkalivibrio sp.]
MNDSHQGEHGDRRRRHDHLLQGLRQFLSADEPKPERLEAHVLIEDAVAARASDVHMDPEPDGYRIRLRIDGLITDALEIDAESGALIVNQIKAQSGLDPMPSLQPASGSFSLRIGEQAVDLRVTAVRCLPGEKLAMRILAPGQMIRSIPDLGVPEREVEWLRRWLETAGGMLLVAGPTGSGKTTSLYALLHEIRHQDLQIVTLEDPVEHELAGVNQIQVDEKQGLGFDEGSIALLRLDPDCVLVGEIRDGPSARAAINIASSGRALMATLHSRDAIGAVTSLRNMGLHDFEIAPNVSAVIAQRLVRRLCPQCRQQVPTDEADRRLIKAYGRKPPEKTWRARGCHACNQIGFRGRIGVFEVWRLRAGDTAAILRHEHEHILREGVAKRGQRLMVDDGLAKAEAGLTTYRELFHAGVLLPTDDPEQ